MPRGFGEARDRVTRGVDFQWLSNMLAKLASWKRIHAEHVYELLHPWKIGNEIVQNVVGELRVD